MNIPDLPLENLKTHLLGRMRLNLFKKITGKENIYPTKEQGIKFVKSIAEKFYPVAELFTYILTTDHYSRIKKSDIKAVRNPQLLLKSLDKHPLSEPILFEIKNFYGRDIAGWVRADQLQDSSGYFYTITLLEENPEKIIFYCEIRSDQTNPEPALVYLNEDGKYSKLNTKELLSSQNKLIRFSIGLLNYVNEKHYDTIIDFEKARIIGPENFKFSGSLPEDKKLDDLIKLLVKRQVFCFETEVEINKITPFSYDQFFKIPLSSIWQAEKLVDKINRIGILLYKDKADLIMSDDYLTYLILRKAGYSKVKAVIVGKSFPRGLKLIRKGGVELLPGFLRLWDSNIDQLSKGLKDQILQSYLDRLNTLKNIDNLISTKYIVLTEDENPDPLKALLLSNGFNIDEAEIYSYKSSANVAGLHLTVKTFRDINPRAKIIIHRDRDYLLDDEVEKIKSIISEAGAKPLITKGTDIESYFINARHIARMCPKLTLKTIKTLITQATNQTKPESIKHIKKHEHGEKYSEKKSYLDQFVNSIYERNVERFRHGKKTLGILIGLLQNVIKKNVKLIEPSEFLKDDEISSLL